MLQGVQTEIGEIRRFGVAENDEDTTLVVEMIVENVDPSHQADFSVRQTPCAVQRASRSRNATPGGAAQYKTLQVGGCPENVSMKTQIVSPQNKKADRYLAEGRRLKRRYEAETKSSPVERKTIFCRRFSGIH